MGLDREGETTLPPHCCIRPPSPIEPSPCKAWLGQEGAALELPSLLGHQEKQKWQAGEWGEHGGRCNPASASPLSLLLSPVKCQGSIVWGNVHITHRILAPKSLQSTFFLTLIACPAIEQSIRLHLCQIQNHHNVQSLSLHGSPVCQVFHNNSSRDPMQGYKWYAARPH